MAHRTASFAACCFASHYLIQHTNFDIEQWALELRCDCFGVAKVRFVKLQNACRHTKSSRVAPNMTLDMVQRPALGALLPGMAYQLFVSQYMSCLRLLARWVSGLWPPFCASVKADHCIHVILLLASKTCQEPRLCYMPIRQLAVTEVPTRTD